MATRRQTVILAKKLGATLSTPEYTERGTFWETQAEAPDGKQWVSSGSLHLVCTFHRYLDGDESRAYDDLILRMTEGLEDLDEELNP